jgi:hypothetical protein
VAAPVVEADRGLGEVEFGGAYDDVGTPSGVNAQHPGDDFDSSTDDVADVELPPGACRCLACAPHQLVELGQDLECLVAHVRALSGELDAPRRLRAPRTPGDAAARHS